MSRHPKPEYWWQKPMEDGDDMISDSLQHEGKEIGITLNAAGTGILLQLGEVPTCHKCELHQIRVTLNHDESLALKHKLERLIGCLPEPPNAPHEPCGTDDVKKSGASTK